MHNLIWLLGGLIFSLWSCQIKPAEINYGSDACHFCKMTIVDRQHAAQVVTVKGKSFKYDAIECMMNHQAAWEGPDVELFLVCDYDNPGELINAVEASYLISPAIPSPMGEFLSAFGNMKSRDKTKNGVGGDAYQWEQLKIEFEVN